MLNVCSEIEHRTVNSQQHDIQKSIVVQVSSHHTHQLHNILVKVHW